MVELSWEGKYDKDGKVKAPLRVALPFQTVETVNESAQQRQRTLDLFAAGRDPEWRNRLIWGDKKYVLPSLLPEFAGKVDLIYIDPPFASGQDFSYQAQIGDEEYIYQPNIIETKAYRDTWGESKSELDKFSGWMYETVTFLHELLSENGSLYVHLDWYACHYIKPILDEVFGRKNYRNEIIWRIGWLSGYKTKKRGWIRNHETILYYIKGGNPVFNKEYIPYPPGYVRRDGKPPTGKGIPIEDTWNCNDADILDSIMIKSFSTEKRGYPTQKPEALLERIIRAS